MLVFSRGFFFEIPKLKFCFFEEWAPCPVDNVGCTAVVVAVTKDSNYFPNNKIMSKFAKNLSLTEQLKSNFNFDKIEFITLFLEKR